MRLRRWWRRQARWRKFVLIASLVLILLSIVNFVLSLLGNSSLAWVTLLLIPLLIVQLVLNERDPQRRDRDSG